MRSKAHKKILNYFLSVWILEKSEMSLTAMVVREEPPLLFNQPLQ